MDRSSTIERLYPLVHRIAGKLAKSLPPHVQHEDLVSSGVIGLIQAVDRFDPSKNKDISAYCCSRIRGAILDDLREQDWIPRRVHEDAKRVKTAQDALEQRLGRLPVDSEIMAEMGVSGDSLAILKARSEFPKFVALDEEALSSLADSPDAFEIMAQAEDKSCLFSAIRSLSKQQQTCLILYYFEDVTMRDIGSILSVSESRVSQILTLSLKHLRNQLQK